MRVCRRFSCGRVIGSGEDVCAECRGQDSLFPVDPGFTPLEQLRLRGQRLDVLTALLEMQAGDPRGANAFELQSWMRDREIDKGIERNAISSRFKELAGEGLVVKVADRTAPTGKSEQVFAPTARAAEWRQRKAQAA